MKNNYEELLEMQDYEMIPAICEGILVEIRNARSEEELKKIPEVKFYLFAANIFDMEMQNGGLCQFLINAGNIHGSMIEEALRVFGAEEHLRLVSEFCSQNGLDLCNLRKLIPARMEPYGMTDFYLRLINEYPFDEFERMYYKLESDCPLQSILATYVRKNISLFV